MVTHANNTGNHPGYGTGIAPKTFSVADTPLAQHFHGVHIRRNKS